MVTSINVAGAIDAIILTTVSSNFTLVKMFQTLQTVTPQHAVHITNARRTVARRIFSNRCCNRYQHSAILWALGQRGQPIPSSTHCAPVYTYYVKFAMTRLGNFATAQRSVSPGENVACLGSYTQAWTERFCFAMSVQCA